MIEERGRAHFEGRQRTKDPAPVCVCGRGRASDGKISAEANGIRTNLADACLRCGRPPRHIEAKLSGRLASACALRSECHSHTRDAHYAGSPVTTWTALVRVVSGAGVPDGPPRCAKRTSTIRTEWMDTPCGRLRLELDGRFDFVNKFRAASPAEADPAQGSWLGASEEIATRLWKPGQRDLSCGRLLGSVGASKASRA